MNRRSFLGAALVSGAALLVGARKKPRDIIVGHHPARDTMRQTHREGRSGKTLHPTILV